MENLITPEAFFDTLSLGHKLDSFLDGFKIEEIFLFSYFSSILYLHDGKPLSEWPHKYTVAKSYPFSTQLNEAINRHLQNGLFENKNDFFLISGRGVDEFNKFKELSSFAGREKYLNAASSTSILVPYSKTLRALLSEPEIKKVEDLDNQSWLLQSDIYKKFSEISLLVGIDSESLIIPAVTWIDYLYEKGKE